MKITQGTYTLEVSRYELLALLKGLSELELLTGKYPEERNGYDLNSRGVVECLRDEMEKHIG
jgi:hypothetical protein